MSAGNPPLFASPDPQKDRLVSARDAQHIARNITDEIVGPMASKLDYVAELLRRLVGDPEDSDIPADLRTKGVLHEMKESQESFFDEQREWKKSNDAENTLAKKEREAIIGRLTKLENSTGKIRRVVVWFIRWITRKDDGLSVAITKIGIVLTGMGTLSIGAWHLAVAGFHRIMQVFHQIK